MCGFPNALSINLEEITILKSKCFEMQDDINTNCLNLDLVVTRPRLILTRDKSGRNLIPFRVRKEMKS